LVPYLEGRGYNVVTQARTNAAAQYLFDLNDWDVSLDNLTAIQPSIIINLVGHTSVEICQHQVNLAYLTNTRTVENIARWIMQTRSSCYLIQISTDHVYDNLGPHVEDQVTITNNYAMTKYAGEMAAAQVYSSVLRANFVGRSKASTRSSLTDWVFSSLSEEKKIQVLSDVLFSPLNMETLSSMVELVIKKNLLVYIIWVQAKG